MKTRRFKRKNLIQAAIFIGLCICSFFFIFPIYWCVTMSVKYKEDILTTVPQYVPTRVTMENYLEIFRNTQFPVYLLNSAVIAVLTTLLCVVVASMAGFGLTRFSFRGNKAVSLGIYIIRMIPGLLYTIPLYIIYLNIGLLDNRMGLVVAYCTFSLPMSVWLFLGFYEEIPREIYESASIDGCSSYRMYWAIALPLVLPSISVVAILCFIGAWNEFGLALTLTFKDTSKTLPIAINSMIQRDRDTPFGSIAAAGTLSMVPAIILSLTMQKYIVKGFTAGAVKG
ncbi:MAG TPA: carbohydrate ABC transporter permease [Candidatus Eisenbergiella stercoravium]|nr:carbohydrate ABC transporter permease [Candidatus Eisenbergiella stercoravium]